MGREPGAGLMRELEGRAEALAGTLNAQNVANMLWAACVFFFSTLVKDGDWCILWSIIWCPLVRRQASILPSCARSISSL